MDPMKPFKGMSIIAERELARARMFRNQMLESTKDIYGIKEVHALYDDPKLYVEQFLNKWIDRVYLGIAISSLILPMYELEKIIDKNESRKSEQKLEEKVNHQTP